MERRYLEPTGIEVRKGEGDAGPVVSGYAAVFDSEAHNEIIRLGAFNKTLKESPRIMALWNHESGKPLASTNTGTLALSEDDRGLRFEMTLDEGTSFGADALRTITKKLITGMSFGFDDIKPTETLREDDDGNPRHPLRELVELRLFEVSPVTFPWYEDTDVGLKDAFSLAEVREWTGMVDASRDEIIDVLRHGSVFAGTTVGDSNVAKFKRFAGAFAEGGFVPAGMSALSREITQEPDTNAVHSGADGDVKRRRYEVEKQRIALRQRMAKRRRNSSCVMSKG